MPLFKRKPYPFVQAPENLKPGEKVYQIRFTGEVFRAYDTYLSRINFYRRRWWTCRSTGKTNLTYEEALLSELKANEQIQNFPAEFKGPVLRCIHYRQARFEELVDDIYRRFRDEYVTGEEVGGLRRNGETHRCVVLECYARVKGEGGASHPAEANPEVLSDEEGAAAGVGDEGEGQGQGQLYYRVRWMGEGGAGSEGEEDEEDVTVEPSNMLFRKRHPLKKELLKAFIRESATSVGRGKRPVWLVEPGLLKTYGIEMEPSEEVREVLGLRQQQRARGEEAAAKRRARAARRVEEEQGGPAREVKEEQEVAVEEEMEEEAQAGQLPKGEVLSEEEQLQDVKKAKKKKRARSPSPSYPCLDQDVRPGRNDPEFTTWPVPCYDYTLPLESVPDLLMVWDFCASFSRALHLSYFSLEDLENAVEARDSKVPLLMEAHTALLRAALGDSQLAERFAKNGRRKREVSVQSWLVDVVAFIEAVPLEPLQPFASSLRRGHYGELGPALKIALLKELVEHAMVSDAVRGQVEENVVQTEALLAQRREEELEERRRKRELKEGQAGEEGRGRKDVEEEGDLGGRGEGDEGDGGGGAGPSDEEGAGPRGQPSKGWRSKGKRSMNGVPGGSGGLDGSAAGSEDGQSNDGDADAPSRGGKGARKSSASTRQERLRAAAAAREGVERERRAREDESRAEALAKRKAAGEAAAERRRLEVEEATRQRRLEQMERDIFEKYAVRTNSLGRDRNYNRYWFFYREGRFFVENEDSSKWGYYNSAEELDQLFHSLNPKGIRELDLQKTLEKHYHRISAALARRSRDLSNRLIAEEAAVRRSSRVKTAPKQASFLSYVNKYSL